VRARPQPASSLYRKTTLTSTTPRTCPSWLPITRPPSPIRISPRR
jgi:hypothetical protein